eukprot:3938539-Rhodomonas_salina.2
MLIGSCVLRLELREVLEDELGFEAQHTRAALHTRANRRHAPRPRRQLPELREAHSHARPALLVEREVRTQARVVLQRVHDVSVGDGLLHAVAVRRRVLRPRRPVPPHAEEPQRCPRWRGAEPEVGHACRLPVLPAQNLVDRHARALPVRAVCFVREDRYAPAGEQRPERRCARFSWPAPIVLGDDSKLLQRAQDRERAVAAGSLQGLKFSRVSPSCRSSCSRSVRTMTAENKGADPLARSGVCGRVQSDCNWSNTRVSADIVRLLPVPVAC